MGPAYLRKIAVTSLLFTGIHSVISQPFVDILNTSYQSLSTTYQNDSILKKNKTENFFLNLTVPIKLDSQNTIIVRFYGERLVSQITEYDASWYSNTSEGVLQSALLPIGLQHELKNKKWKFLGLVMPKLSGELISVSNYDFQLGGYVLATYAKSPNFKVKFGMFYNREFFGNFFIPVFAIDWKVSERFQMYGALPNFYKLEFALLPKHLYAGLAFKSYTRSYHIYSESPLYSGRFYVRNNEIQAKAFVDMYFAKKFVLFAEFGRTIGYGPKLYDWGTKDLSAQPGVYSPIKDAFFFNAGLAYRIRFDFN